MDQAAVDEFLKHYRLMTPEDLAALDQRRDELVPEAIAALEIVLKDAATQKQVAEVAGHISKVIAPKPLGFGILLSLLFCSLLAYGPIQFISVYVSDHGHELTMPSLVTIDFWQRLKLLSYWLSGLLTLVSVFAALKLYRHRRRQTIRKICAVSN